MYIETFAIIFQASEFKDYCCGELFRPVGKHINKIINDYCKINNRVECDRSVTTSICEENGTLIVTVTSKFNDK